MTMKAMLYVLAAVIRSGVHLWHTYTEVMLIADTRMKWQ